jgi:endogenous inhibitor of DNA gyrase (YacG/DUF329 family)
MAAAGKAGAGGRTAAVARKCPICGKDAVAGFDPFCSKRCADIDLHRWLSGSYAIPAVENDDDPSEEEPPDRDHDR